MSVIIRLQNLPWSANALDIRQFFKGLSIPEGGVHIVGGEMGDAFIAFSTDEDARQAMMHDRKKINEVQVRLLLSSRAEMQKVIETARQHSMLALQNAQKNTGLATTTVSAPYTMPPQPPIITSSSLQTILSNSIGATPSFLAYQQQAGITITEQKTAIAGNGKLSVVQQSGGETSRERPRSKSGSRERRSSCSRERNSRRRRSRDRSRSREKKARYPSRRSKSKDRERESVRNRDHLRNSARITQHYKEKEPNLSNSRSAKKSATPTDSDGNHNAKAYLTAMPSWSVPPLNPYTTNYSICLSPSSHNNLTSTIPLASLHSTTNSLNSYTTGSSKSVTDSIKFTTSTTNAPIIIPAFQSYTSTAPSTTNDYSINVLANSNSNSSDSTKAFTLKNPYTTAIQAANSNSQDKSSSFAVQKEASTMFSGLILEGKCEEISSTTMSNPMQGDQEPIAFASTNPYEQIYPGLFAKAAALSSVTKLNSQNPSTPKENPTFDKFPDSCCIKISNMCGSTTYSDLRKFFSGLFIPHNGIKMVNDRHGLRAGIAYIQFSRVSNVQKAISRNNTLLKGKAIQIEVVSENEFETIEDSFRPQSRFDKVDRSSYGGKNDSDSWTEGNNGVETISKRKGPTKDQEKLDSFTVLYIEDIPALTTEQDIIKMFSSYSIYDILLTSSPENRREFIAHVKFSRESEAKSALEDKSRHLIGYRKVRVRPGQEANMEKAKEKLRLANEQLLKEEQSIIDIDFKQNEAMKNEHPNGSAQKNHDTVNNNIGNKTDVECNPINPFNPNCFTVDSKTTHIPSIFDLNAPKPDSLESGKTSDPRLIPTKSKDESILKIEPPVNCNTYNSSASSFMYQSDTMENNFILLKNCEYNLRINDLAQLFLSSNLKLKHIELLRNDRQIPSGEFIVEFQNSQDADKAISNFNNTRFRSRNIKVHHISPQEIADRLQKPFLNYLPTLNGRPSQSCPETFDYQSRPNESDMRSNENAGYCTGLSVPSTRGMRSLPVNNNSSSRMRGTQQRGRTYHNMNDNRDEADISDSKQPNQEYGISNKNDENYTQEMAANTFNASSRFNEHSANAEGEDGIPEKFTRPGCVLTMENVPFKADLKDILSFFHEYHLLPDDIIRRFNDDGSPTGDARVAFESPAIARAAFEAKRRKHIFNRTIYISIL